MVEQKLITVQEGPEKILIGIHWVFVLGSHLQAFGDFGYFRRPGRPVKGRKV